MKATFPMYVLPAARMLTLERLPTHEEIRDELVEWREGMTTLFVSQTWLSYSHPDNESNSKLRLLQHFLRRAATGKFVIAPSMDAEIGFGKKLQISADQAKSIEWVWFDVTSVPQADPATQGQAIASLPAYVARSAFFLVLAGAWEHENGSVRDYRAWHRRGWCRLECLANALAPRAKQIILMQSRSDIKTFAERGITGMEWLMHGIGEGAFTVEADRAALGPVVLALINERMEAKRAEGTEEAMRWYRMLHALKPTLLSGLPAQEPYIETLDAWLSHLGYSAATDVDSKGWAPLRYVTVEGRLDLAAELLARGADVEGKVYKCTANEIALNGYDGMNNLHAALFLDRGPMCRLLLTHGAESIPKWSAMHPLGMLYIFGHVSNLEVLHELAPHSVEMVSIPAIGCTLISQPFYASKTAAMLWLMERVPESCRDDKTGIPMGILGAMVMFHGETDALSVALETKKFDLQYFNLKASTLPYKILRGVGGLNLRFLKGPSKLLEFAALSAGTALHVASFNGNLPAVELLLTHKADVNSHGHQRKMTPLHVAAAMGHDEVCTRLLRADASTTARDSLKRTPASWARRRGHEDLARLLSEPPELRKSVSSTVTV